MSNSSPDLARVRPDNALVLTYYQRHPQRARTRLLDLLGEVLVPTAAAAAPAASPGAGRARAGGPETAGADDGVSLWRQSSSGVAPLKQKK